MRLREIYHTLNHAIPQLTLDAEGPTNTTAGPAHKVKNKVAVINAFRKIARLPGFGEIASSEQLGPLLELALAEPFIPQQEFTQLDRRIASVRIRCEMLFTSLRSIITPDNPNTLSIKLPPLQDLDDLSKMTDRVMMAFDRPSAMVFGEHPKLKGFDVGTNWIEILSSKPVTDFLTALVTGAFTYLGIVSNNRRSIEALRIQSPEILTALNNELRIKELEARRDIAIELVRAHYSDRPAEKQKYTHDEVVTEVSHAVGEVAVILQDGGEVRPSFLLPQEAQNAVPTSEEIKQVTGGLTPISHQLAERTKEDGTDQ